MATHAAESASSRRRLPLTDDVELGLTDGTRVCDPQCISARAVETRNYCSGRLDKAKLPAMSKERFGERQADVRDSAARLAEAVAQPPSELIRDATIQRFEFTFEVVWKTLKLYLERQGYECGGPRPTLKKAFAEHLIPNPEEADVWLQMLEDRNLTAHAYDEALASRIHGHIVHDYAPLLAGMAHRIQTLAWD